MLVNEDGGGTAAFPITDEFDEADLKDEVANEIFLQKGNAVFSQFQFHFGVKTIRSDLEMKLHIDRGFRYRKIVSAVFKNRILPP